MNTRPIMNGERERALVAADGENWFWSEYGLKPGNDIPCNGLQVARAFDLGRLRTDADEPVRRLTRIEFETVFDLGQDSYKAGLICEEVAEELKLLAPLLVEERLLKMRLEDTRAKIKEINK